MGVLSDYYSRCRPTGVVIPRTPVKEFKFIKPKHRAPRFKVKSPLVKTSRVLLKKSALLRGRGSPRENEQRHRLRDQLREELRGLRKTMNETMQDMRRRFNNVRRIEHENERPLTPGRGRIVSESSTAASTSSANNNSILPNSLFVVSSPLSTSNSSSNNTPVSNVLQQQPTIRNYLPVASSTPLPVPTPIVYRYNNNITRPVTPTLPVRVIINDSSGGNDVNNNNVVNNSLLPNEQPDSFVILSRREAPISISSDNNSDSTGIISLSSDETRRQRAVYRPVSPRWRGPGGNIVDLYVDNTMEQEEERTPPPTPPPVWQQRRGIEQLRRRLTYDTPSPQSPWRPAPSEMSSNDGSTPPPSSSSRSASSLHSSPSRHSSSNTSSSSGNSSSGWMRHVRRRLRQPRTAATPASAIDTTPPHYRLPSSSIYRNGAYDFNFVNRLANVSPQSKAQVKRMRLNLRKRWLEKYFQRRGLPRPMELNTPPQQQQSPGGVRRPFIPAALRTPPRPTLIAPPNPPTPDYPAIPFPQVHLTEEELADIENMEHDLPPARAEDYLAPGELERATVLNLPDALDGMDVLFQQREEDRLKREQRTILEAFCASTKSNMDLRIFNRDYLQCVARTINTVL
eukprot:Seg4081.6 transcript_id=Seg4081.6/GoldUCD/mRNA.D3Y31 product="hypothetical protein" protein_id=Seg4081.6/GoldUCD/D3Y31